MEFVKFHYIMFVSSILASLSYSILTTNIKLNNSLIKNIPFIQKSNMTALNTIHCTSITIRIFKTHSFVIELQSIIVYAIKNEQILIKGIL